MKDCQTCQKTALSFDNRIYEQSDGISMGSSLGLVLETEHEKTFDENLIEN